ncbi:uncharacterized protein LOC143068375 isoform X2 [Mytilus galloprovincialis]|uniref:uncharacterized protein LOC143068375 isoform X2 n=1 Tax=Mytilus galloprovincialis TaxID=29158 RepID=UPI003F7C4F0C
MADPPQFHFPVGKETEHSIKLLFKFFCNNLFLGQWELARSCIARLNDEKAWLKADIRKILTDIIYYPFSRSIANHDIGSSHQLSWLCLQEYKLLLEDKEKEEKDNVLLEKSCEFRILLLEACVDASEQIIKDLYLYQRAVSKTYYDDESTDQPVSLTTDLLKFLRDKLLENPLLGHSVICSIYACSKHSQYKKNNENLQGLYIKAVNILLDKISNSQQKNQQENIEKVEKVYKIISLYNPEGKQYQNYLPIRELFARIYELSVTYDHLIDRHKVLSVIIGRENTYLVEEFCKVEYDLELKYFLTTASYQGDELSEEQKCLLTVVNQREKKQQMRLLFLMCVKKQQHFLKIVVDTSIALIKTGQFKLLRMLLEPAEFQPLKPFLLLHGWSYCHSCQTAKQLLDALWSEESSCFHPALQTGCSKLAYQIDLIQWCLDKTKPLVAEVSLTNQHQRAADMFTGLENHSVLYVLHQSTRIASLNQQEVLDILQKSPLENDNSGGTRSRVKAVTFAEDKEEKTTDKETDQSLDINIERWRDISIFSGYCAVKNVMDAVYFCIDYSDGKMTNPIQRKDYRSHSILSNSDASSVQSKTSSEFIKSNFQNIYTKNVFEKLKSACEYLSKLQPLTYRVEIIEDIYSLLFVNHECIQESAFYEEFDSDEDFKEDDYRRNNAEENSRISTFSEDSLTSPEPASPRNEKKVFDLTNDELKSSLAGSYDEPFMERHPKKVDKIKKITSNYNGFTDSDNLQKLGKNKTEISKRSKGMYNNRITEPTLENRACENDSTFSTDSSLGLISVGFLNNEYLVRDILDMLKDALLDLEGALFHVRGSYSEKSSSSKKSSKKQTCNKIIVSIEEPLTNIVQCSVTKESLQTRISSLRHYIHEANWKYQLVCHEKIPREPGEVLLEPIVVSMGIHEEEICTDLIGQKERKRRLSERSQKLYKTPSPLPPFESESQGGDSGNDGGRIIKRARSRSRGRSLSKSKFPAGIISLMLSSPETLLIMCVQRCNYNQASQVTKLMKLEDRPEAVEVSFAQRYASAVKKLHSLNLGLQRTAPANPGKLSLKALGSVAAAGVATVSVSSVADELLSLQKLPKIPHPKCQVVQTSKLDRCFKQENCPSMILFDLLCTGCRSWEMCNNMIDAIRSRRTNNGSEKSDYRKTRSHSERGDKVSHRLKDLWEITEQFEVLLQLGLDLDGHQKQFNIKNVLHTFYKHSIQALLKTATIPIYSENANMYAKLLTDLKFSIDKVEHVFQIYGKLPLEGQIHKSPKTSPYSSPNSRGSPRASPSSPNSRGSPKVSPSKSGDAFSSDKPVIHNAMKNLIGVLQNDLPPGGLYRLFVRTTTKENVTNRDYLQNLYDHLKGLAIVVAESEATSKENFALPKNYFKMLDEGPISTLGRLMFSKKIPPYKLERVAKKLSLNLNHIIVHSCCPKIPSKQLPALTSGFRLNKVIVKGSHMVMNQLVPFQRRNTVSNPEPVVREIMTKLVFLMKDIARQNNAKGIFEISSAKMMIKTAEFADIISSTQKLNGADLDRLQTKEEKVSFFGNVQNLMFIHMCLFLIEEAVTKMEEDNESGGDKSAICFTDLNLIDQLLHLNMFSYHLGQMGNVSLFDVKYLINRNGLLPPSKWNGLLENRISELDIEDPWNRYIPSPDPRILFVTTNCTNHSPAVQILIPELLKSQLQLAMRGYLDDGVSVNKDNRKVTIPQLLLWYKHDFSHQQVQDFSAENEGIIHIIAGHMTGQQQTSLQELLEIDRVHSYSGENIDETGRKELPFKVEEQSVRGEFLVAFDNTHLLQNQIFTKGHKRMTSLPKNIDLSISKSVTSSTKSFGKYAPKHSLTPATLEYVKSECPLVATLVSLVCDDELDDIDPQFAEDHFSGDENLRGRAPSEISLVDIRSYRYQKLTDSYPSLKQHLLNYIVPIAGSQDEEIIKSRDPVLKLITSSISDKLKACMLCLHCSQPFQDVVKSVLNSLITGSKWLKILEILHSFPSTVIQNDPKYAALTEISLECIIFHRLSQSPFPSKLVADEICSALKRFNDCTKACHILLSIYKKLPLDVVQDLFHSFDNVDIDNQLKETVATKLKEINLYIRITECAKTLQVKLSMSTDFHHPGDKGDYYSFLERFNDWRNIMTVIAPDEVFTVLLKAKDYETAKKWCHMKNFRKDQCMTVVERQLLYLLNGKTVDTTKAFLILEDLREEDGSSCFEICNKLLELLNNQREILFIVSYMLKYLTIPQEKLEEYKLIKIGSKALLCLPTSIHNGYNHLVKSPHLLLEQLLMNMKIELAGKVYSAIQSELDNFETSAINLKKDVFNNLVTTYAKKALDFTVVMVPILEKDRSQSVMSTASSDRLDSPSDLPPTPTKTSVFSESVRSQRRGIDISASPRASISGPSGMSHNKISPTKKSKFNATKFVMPLEPPSPDKWQPDNSTDTCMVCKEERFSMFNRRHHCRRCGRVVCGTCSTKKSTVKNISVRTCDDCYKQIFGDRIQEVVEEEMYKQRGDNSAQSSLSRTMSPGLHVIEEPLSMADTIQHTEMLWKLETDEDEANEFTREDFYFEQAPSTSLCLSILGLHGDTKLSGKLMLEMCDDLSKHLKQLAPGIPNPEVDYSLLLSMMKTLLFHAKITFSKSTKGSDGIVLCDVYQSRIDLLSILVTDNFTDLPSLQELTKPEIVRRLRDSLIKDERLELAVEVSTKCGLDPAGVWAEWGMNCLQSGDLQAAREKFSRCLKPPSDRNAIQLQPSKIITDIIDCLEAMPSTGQGELQLLMSSPGSLKNLLSASMNFTEETATDSIPFKECLYYLKTYASFNIIIDFYRRNGYWMKAVQYILDHKCSSEVFVEALLVPAISCGEWAKLVDQMVMTDPSLERWNLYLKSTCKYLLKQKLHYILYEFQLVMKDFVRAAMTCITCFYQRGAESYIDLAERISFLYKAHNHLQSYMDPSQWGSVSRPLPQGPKSGSRERSIESNTDSGVLIQTEEQVGKHLKTISIQIEVTKFLHHCLKNTDSNAAAIATKYIANSKSSTLPTMFGTNKTRTDLVNMILLSGNDIPPAFELGLRIIKECNLGGQVIYTHTAREMAKHQRYDHIRQLLNCLVKVGMGEDDMIDEMIGACILVVADNPNEAKEAENLIKLLRKDSHKINAYILCGKLRSAYLMAVKAERVEDVQRIAGAAQRMGQTAVKNICNKWLEQKKNT